MFFAIICCIVSINIWSIPGVQCESPLPTFESDYSEIMKGLETITLPRNPSYLLVYGKEAFPLTYHRDGIVVAGARYKEGRVLAAGRDSFINSQPQFWTNVVGWLSKGKTNPVVATNTMKKIPGFNNTLTEISTNQLINIDVYYVNGHDSMTDDEIKMVLKFVENGGGLIVLGQCWYTNDKNEFTGNRILSTMGIYISHFYWGTLSHQTSEMPKIESNIYYAYQSILTQTEIAKLDVSRHIINRYTSIYFENFNYGPFQDIIKKITSTFFQYQNQIDINKDIYTMLAQKLIGLIVNTDLIDNVKADRFAPTFPYTIPVDTPLINTKVTVIGNTKEKSQYRFMYAKQRALEWKSTGLYAPAGKKVKYTIPKDVVGKITIQIGCHTDNLTGNKQPRLPLIVYNYKTKNQTGYIFNPSGGLIYIIFEHGSKLGEINIAFEGVVRAPYFVLGKTDLNSWDKTESKYPGPWAEIEIPDQLIITIPSKLIRDNKDVQEYAEFWKHLMITMNNFYGFPNGTRYRAERLVHDIQISHGSLHTGYPIMGFIQGRVINATHFKKYGDWGYFHELGHHHQVSTYTVSRMMDSTCNLYSKRLMQETTERQGDKGHPALPNMRSRIFNWYMNGKHTSQWAVWVAFDTFVILQEHFGYDSYTKTFQFYDANVSNDEHIKGDTEILRNWVIRYSNTVKKNLCPYFDWWKFPLTNETWTHCNQFPMPSKDIMKYLNYPSIHRSDCPEGWSAYGNNCYIYVDSEKNWFDAENHCQSLDERANLPSCLSENEILYLKFKAGNKRTWIGFNNMEGGNLTNLDGSAVNETDIASKITKKLHCGVVQQNSVTSNICYNKNRFICRIAPKSCGPKYTCPKGWIKYHNKCYFWHTVSMTPNDADQFCKVSGANLVEFTDKDEENFVITFTKPYRSLYSYYWTSTWMGLKELDRGNFNHWDSGANVEYTNWCRNQPTNLGNGTVFLAAYYNCWDDTSNANRKEAPLCEMDAVPI